MILGRKTLQNSCEEKTELVLSFVCAGEAQAFVGILVIALKHLRLTTGRDWWSPLRVAALRLIVPKATARLAAIGFFWNCHNPPKSKREAVWRLC